MKNPLGEPVLVGQLVDRVGARSVVVGAQLAQAVGFIGYLAVSTYLATFQYGFNIANILAPGMFALLFSHDRALPWLVVAGLAALGTAGMASLERTLPATAVRGERDEAADQS